MTVKQLIENLKKCDPSYEVCVEGEPSDVNLSQEVVFDENGKITTKRVHVWY